MDETRALDYSNRDRWYKIPEITKDVDTFYICATEYILSSLEEGAPAYAPLDNEEMLQGWENEYVGHATAYEGATNVFMPYYRQAGMPTLRKAWKETGDCEAGVSGMPYTDVVAALDYYFENFNQGRPFILAAHSQGSLLSKLVLKRYMVEHPDYLDRMVAAYLIGYAVTRDEIEANPHLKFATGETDTGVIISYNTEGPKNSELNVKTVVLLPNALCINPLNWKVDDTYAPASENLGSLVENEETGEVELGNLDADAQVNVERGVVVTHAKALPLPEGGAEVAAEYFGPDGRHGDDYTYYYANIKDNVGKRVAAYLKSR